MGFSLYVTCCFFLAAFHTLSLCLIILSLFNMCLSVFLLGFVLSGTLCASWIWLTISSFFLWKFLTIIASKIFSYPYFLFFFRGPYNSNVAVFIIIPEASETILHSFHSFDFILLFRSYFHHFIFQLTGSFFCFRYSAIDSF